jgi:hypothetical protein
MLEKKGGWDIKPMDRLNWYGRTPYRWSQLLSDKFIDATERTTDRILASVGGLTSGSCSGGNDVISDGGEDEISGGTRRAVQELTDTLQPYISQAKQYFQPYNEKLSNYVELIVSDPKLEEITKKFTTYEQQIEGAYGDLRLNIRNTIDDLTHRYEIYEKYMRNVK